MGTLNLYLQRSQTGSEQLLFRESGDHGNQWIQSRVDVYSSVDYFLIFEAVQDIDVASLSDMALDDIKFLPYPCNSIRKFVICGWLWKLSRKTCYLRIKRRNHILNLYCFTSDKTVIFMTGCSLSDAINERVMKIVFQNKI